jgi:energy-coupling factor transport system ATP-binding protein
MHKGKAILDGEPADVFKESELLESVGLAVPQVTYLIKELRKKGFDLSEDIFTIDQAVEALQKILK